jgi:microcompartment protein CcmL/EutN
MAKLVATSKCAIKRRPINNLDTYLEEETLDVGSNLDILQYWKMHSTTYPILARMAGDILAVPASMVASESAFSTGGRVVSDYRSRLKSETIEAVICLQDWPRSEDSTHDNTAENVAVDESDCI